ncbi:DEAD/DEAH box helicase [Saccharicrinis fermentans]|uniref:ATP-dependent RNA helicase RhlE n=1 Tax=Saccharicrinis fermentans DSM 9555 = JCM 21142 TaxID=869213 RepID=W7Y963_9BACT|nr:DEAD/DEAH box helicase [Saccharicrinis fermentans]GAF04852.1 ATP-dependent RNA helicase RhlE [Saccharicrinis fermentans DSM 9555 = JCM 21142]
MKFEDYSIAAEIKTSLAKLNYRRPTDIQFKSIPPILKGEDVLAIAQTGTGKTAAFAIPVINQLHMRKIKGRMDGIKCLVMVPTRELAIQIHQVFETIGKHTRVKSFCVFGGVEEAPQIARLEKGIDVLIATPGRMFDLASRGFIKLDRIEVLILDEADHMLDLGFIKDIRDIMTYLRKKNKRFSFRLPSTKLLKNWLIPWLIMLFVFRFHLKIRWLVILTILLLMWRWMINVFSWNAWSKKMKIVRYWCLYVLRCGANVCKKQWEE